MKYKSTRGRVGLIDFQDAVIMGLGDDGGLLVPQSIPDVRGRLKHWSGLEYNDLAFEIIRLFAGDIPDADLRSIINRSYSKGVFDPAVAPVVKTGPLHVLELWHGPTLAFKDVALQMLGNLFEHILSRRGGELNILGATSGDTGSAAIYGVRGRRGIRIFIMHPAGRVSPIQERQMTTVLDENVHNIAVDGSFDDCQRIMKQIAGDVEFKRAARLGAVNSVNWARVLAQIVYFFSAAFDVQKSTGAAGVKFSVPTGNFGDVLAGWYAMKMGAPINQLILATNANDILSRFFNTGVYSTGKVYQTSSPSMDIQVASNFERYLYYKVGEDPQKLSDMMNQFGSTGSLSVPLDQQGKVDADFVAGAADEQQVLDTIAKHYRDYNYVLDPHTAVGVSTAMRLAGDDAPVICLATAHPAKFPSAIQKATGQDIGRHPAIDKLMNLPTRCLNLPGEASAVKDLIAATIGL
jgi:threonine synthase